MTELRGVYCILEFLATFIETIGRMFR